MPQKAWSNKRERQYKHIKSSLHSRGVKGEKAEEIAARTVNKERARSGEAKQRSRSSVKDISSGRRGGLRSHTGPQVVLTISSTTKRARKASRDGRR